MRLYNSYTKYSKQVSKMQTYKNLNQVSKIKIKDLKLLHYWLEIHNNLTSMTSMTKNRRTILKKIDSVI